MFSIYFNSICTYKLIHIYPKTFFYYYYFFVHSFPVLFCYYFAINVRYLYFWTPSSYTLSYIAYCSALSGCRTFARGRHTSIFFNVYRIRGTTQYYTLCVSKLQNRTVNLNNKNPQETIWHVTKKKEKKKRKKSFS